MLAEVINIVVCVLGLVLLVEKLSSLREHRKTFGVSHLSTIIVAFVASDAIDVLCTWIFTVNSIFRQVTARSAWNDMHPLIASVLRMAIFGSSWWALIVARRACRKERQRIAGLSQDIARELCQ